MVNCDNAIERRFKDSGLMRLALAQSIFVLLAFGKVMIIIHNGLNAGLIQKVRKDTFQPAPLPIFVTNTSIHRKMNARLLERHGHALRDEGSIFFVDQLKCIPTNKLV